MGGALTSKQWKFWDYAFLPIDWALDGASAPAAAEDFDAGTGAVRIRKFDSSSAEDVVFHWEVPEDVVVEDGIYFKSIGFITEGTAPSGEGISTKLSGFCIGNDDSLNGTFGTEVESNITGISYAQNDRFQTAWSTVVTVTDLTAGETALLHYERDPADGDDTYGQDVGLSGIVIKFARRIQNVV